MSSQSVWSICMIAKTNLIQYSQLVHSSRRLMSMHSFEITHRAKESIKQLYPAVFFTLSLCSAAGKAKFNQQLPASYIPTSRIHPQQPRPSGTEYRDKRTDKYPYIKDPHIPAHHLPTTRYILCTTFSATGKVYFCLCSCSPVGMLLVHAEKHPIISYWCRVSRRLSLGVYEENASLFLFCVPRADIGFRHAGSIRAEKVNPGILTPLPWRDLICSVTCEELPARLMNHGTVGGLAVLYVRSGLIDSMLLLECASTVQEAN